MDVLRKYAFVLACLLLPLSAANGVALAAGLPAPAQETSENPAVSPASSPDSKDISITVYNQNFGLVRDVREIMLKAGTNHIKFDDVAAGIDPTSVSFVSLTAPNSVAVREQNYRFDLMDLHTILSRSVGRNVKFRQQLPSGSERILEGQLLSAPFVVLGDAPGRMYPRPQAIVVKTASGVVIAPQGELELAELPKGLVSKPCLFWKIEADKSAAHKAEISYQTQGLNWKCDYVAVDNADDTSVDLTSWVTLDNKSGATYKDASLKLLAGDVHRVTQNEARQGQDAGLLLHDLREATPQFSEQSFAEYHLYSLAGKTDLHNNETKQLTLFAADSVPVKKLFIFEPINSNSTMPVPGFSDPTKIKVKIELENSKKNNMGMALPKGKVRVYKRDSTGALQFIGEDLIDHTPRDEKVRLEIGNAFDIVGELKQTNFNMTKKIMHVSYEVSLRNHKEAPITVTFVGHAAGDWKIVDSGMTYTKKDSTTYEYAVPVEKNGESRFTYAVETRLP